MCRLFIFLKLVRLFPSSTDFKDMEHPLLSHVCLDSDPPGGNVLALGTYQLHKPRLVCVHFGVVCSVGEIKSKFRVSTISEKIKILNFKSYPGGIWSGIQFDHDKVLTARNVCIRVRSFSVIFLVLVCRTVHALHKQNSDRALLGQNDRLPHFCWI